MLATLSWAESSMILLRGRTKRRQRERRKPRQFQRLRRHSKSPSVFLGSALERDMIRLPSLKLYFSNIRDRMLPTQHAIWMYGPKGQKWYSKSFCTFLSERQSTSDTKDNTNTLDNERPEPEIPANNEAREDRLDFCLATSGC